MNDSSDGRRMDLRGLRILLIEDEIILSSEMMDELEAAEAIVLGPLFSVNESLNYIAPGDKIHAALINVNLRGELSFPVADALAGKGIPFIFVTGNDLFVRDIYPKVPVHPKPAHIPAIIDTLKIMLGRLSEIEEY